MRIRRGTLAFALAGFVAIAAACTDLGGLAGSGGVQGTEGGPGKKDGSSDLDASCGGVPPAPSARCDTEKPFGPPTLVTAFDPTAEFVKDAILSHDELEAFFLTYKGSGNWDLRHARRTSLESPWGTVVTEAVTPSPDGTISLTAADLKLYFWTIESDYRTTRSSTGSAFGTPTKFDVASAPAAFFVAADDVAYFSVYEGDASFEKVIKRATVNSSGFSFTSVNVPNIHVKGFNDSHPVLNASETALYFSSNRPGGLGLDDAWVVRRVSKAAEFETPVHLAALSTDETDTVTWVSDDECQVFLYRASHVYLAVRPR